jgi:hypothetical protein
MAVAASYTPDGSAESQLIAGNFFNSSIEISQIKYYVIFVTSSTVHQAAST